MSAEEVVGVLLSLRMFLRSFRYVCLDGSNAGIQGDSSSSTMKRSW